MNDILLATIPAVIVLIAMLSVRFVEHYLQSKRETGRQKLERERETRDAKRRYRESIITPLREAITKLQTSLETQSLVNHMSKAKEKGVSLKPETTKNIELLKEQLQRGEAKSLWEVLTELVPLAAAITNADVREHVEKAFLYFGLGKKIREELNITDEDMKEAFSTAHQNLEDYVALAD